MKWFNALQIALLFLILCKLTLGLGAIFYAAGMVAFVIFACLLFVAGK